MPDTFHGKRRLSSPEQGALNRDSIPAANRRHRRISARLSATRRAWIEQAGAVHASTPMWASRKIWLAQVTRWAFSAAGRKLCAQWHIRQKAVVQVATAMADFADGATGRNCAATNRSIAAAAGCSESLVTRVRNHILGAAGFAVESRRGSGGNGRPNKASVWHLIPSASAPQPEVSDLPTSRREGGLTHLPNQSPRARTRAGKSANKRGKARGRPAPRPLSVQKLAAAFIARSVGLERVHPGQVCDALTQSGLDLAHWDAGQLAAALDTDMRQRGINWPDRITRPAAFLAARLRRLPNRPQLGEHTPTPPRKEFTPNTVATSDPTTRRAALAQMRADVAAAAALWRPRLQPV
ncbi:MAG: hypothetical protein O3B27_00380 [Actinomycetota bacterium]|nr:hypothetical protein [Actinomycetota bacterium]